MNFPVVIFDTDLYPYVFPSQASLAGWLEPLMVEEFMAGFDSKARPITIDIKAGVVRACLLDEIPNEPLLRGYSSTALRKFERKRRDDHAVNHVSFVNQVDLDLLFKRLDKL